MIALTTMTPAAFTQWQDQAIRAYAKDKVTAQTWSKETASAKAQAEFARLLPQGPATANEWLWTIEQTGIPVGNLWVHHDPQTHSSFIYDFAIAPAYQDQGLGQATLTVLSQFLRDQGVTKVGLHVFGDNLRAQHVYQKLGFITTDLSMTKTLD